MGREVFQVLSCQRKMVRQLLGIIVLQMVSCPEASSGLTHINALVLHPGCNANWSDKEWSQK
jgi:hypothetical protein